MNSKKLIPRYEIDSAFKLPPLFSVSLSQYSEIVVTGTEQKKKVQ